MVVLKEQQRGWRTLGSKMRLPGQGGQDLLLSPQLLRGLPGPGWGLHQPRGATGRSALLSFPPAGWRGQTAPASLTAAPLEPQSPSAAAAEAARCCKYGRLIDCSCSSRFPWNPSSVGDGSVSQQLPETFSHRGLCQQSIAGITPIPAAYCSPCLAALCRTKARSSLAQGRGVRAAQGPMRTRFLNRAVVMPLGHQHQPNPMLPTLGAAP